MPKLLIVDDEIDIREFAKKFFSKRHINVFIASGGGEALQLIENERPDLVLLDINMEQMNGIEVLKRLREKKDTTRVIMVTGVNAENVVKEISDLGIEGYIHKPLILEELQNIVMAKLEINK